MSAHAQPRLSEEEYLALDRASQLRHEFYDGSMYAMSGGSHRHGIIGSSLGRELGNALKGKPCYVSNSDVRVRISPGRSYVYPDAVVVCGDPKYADDQKDTLLNPTLVIEVLSDSTERHDRGYKAEQYRKIDSLQEYALVSQARSSVEIYRRRDNGQWLLTHYTGLDAVAHFESVDCNIPLAEIYDKISFDPEPDPLP
jgi:Uma2 family endonuclease